MDGGINVKNIVTYLKNFVFEGSYQTIWFLNALWVAIAVVFVLLKHIEPKYIFFLSLPFYTISCLLSSWHGAFIKLPFGQLFPIYIILYLKLRKTVFYLVLLMFL